MRHFLFMIAAACLLAGCQGPTNITGQEDQINEEPDVIETHGRIENIEQLDQFVKNVQNETDDNVVVVRHTIEGDPIYYKLDYDSNVLDYTVDTTEDAYGPKEVRTIECKGIEKKVTNTETTYTITGCPSGSPGEFFTIRHDVSQQDYFGFHLKYGTEKRNEINTKEMEVIKDLGNGNKATIKDFQFSNEELNQIYKHMVFANYLEEKNVTKECHEPGDERYEMTVWINAGKRHYEWSECDQSEDGKEMTQLVQDILGVAEENSSYQSIKE
ncbi:DUF4362 domain-containing protein [Alkalihalobacillus sp. AL-G]|uniref:DUF4362 domain-containing protein n=1 Tax=Alkalihalobacillus sp. AL-G TaxID=2926399 RepID=UPI00272B2172|nr:DUF4362 domain-containing protein [Alkalihalobacillus sp. AL-G]WLD93418.1 DUF4362 domain-containing protein [Alkalihalobacillus sp. AL-G]